MTDLVLTPAACYPVYPAIAARGRLPAGGVTIDAGGSYVFRHEPSRDPARMQMFHQREIVRIGEPEAVQCVARPLARAGARAARRHRPAGRARRRDRSVLRTQRPHARREPARAAAEVRGAQPDRGAGADRAGVVQLPPGALRLGLRDHASRTAPRRTPPASGSVWSGSRSRSSARMGSTLRSWPARFASELWEPMQHGAATGIREPCSASTRRATARTRCTRPSARTWKPTATPTS